MLNQIIKNYTARFLRSDHGVTLLEYGIALIIAVTIGAAGMTFLGAEVSLQITEAGEAL